MGQVKIKMWIVWTHYFVHFVSILTFQLIHQSPEDGWRMVSGNPWVLFFFSFLFLKNSAIFSPPGTIQRTKCNKKEISFLVWIWNPCGSHICESFQNEVTRNFKTKNYLRIIHGIILILHIRILKKTFCILGIKKIKKTIIILFTRYLH